MKGIFITFEGPDGSGKTTQIAKLKSWFEDKGFSVVITREPGGTELGEDIRKILLDVKHKEMDAKAEMLLYAAARAQHVVKLIKPALGDGKIVLSDRFVDSSYAYQGIGRDLGFELLEAVNKIALSGVEPDLTILLNLNPEKGLHRSFTSKSVVDRLESENLSFHEKVHEGFLLTRARYAKRIKEINADNSIDDVFEQILKHVNDLIMGRNII